MNTATAAGTSPTLAEQVLDAVGGTGNVVANATCMTRLRVRVGDMGLVRTDALGGIHGVLGVVRHADDDLDVVFGPNLVGRVFADFSKATGLPNDKATFAADLPLVSATTHPDSGDAAASQTQAAALADALGEAATGEGSEGVGALAKILNDEPVETPARLRLLVLNGPNINMLGIREPEIYGTEDYGALLDLCHETAREAGFVECSCVQSNHEGDLVDAIQDAYQRFDGIVLNPGAYTHTSVALLDALKAVQIPAIEVHISKLDVREPFRQVSYVRRYCFETIQGLGLAGYRKAILDMAAHLEGTAA